MFIRIEPQRGYRSMDGLVLSNRAAAQQPACKDAKTQRRKDAKVRQLVVADHRPRSIVYRLPSLFDNGKRVTLRWETRVLNAVRLPIIVQNQ